VNKCDLVMINDPENDRGVGYMNNATGKSNTPICESLLQNQRYMEIGDDTLDLKNTWFSDLYNEPDAGQNKNDDQGMGPAQINDFVSENDGPVGIPVCELTYVSVHVDGATKHSYRAMIDSGAMLPIVRKSVISGMEIASMGSVKIQGIFDNGVVAPLIQLNVAVCDDADDNCHGSLMPIMFAAVDSMNADCDIIMPEIVIHDLHTNDQPITVSGISGIVDGEQKLITDEEHELVMDGGDTIENEETFQDELQGHGDYENVDDMPVEIVNPDNLQELIADQHKDESLKMFWEMAKKDKGGMFIRDGALYHRDKVLGWCVEQLCVPIDRREEVMRLAHQTLTGGHLRAQKTRERIRLTYYRPNMRKQILSYCQACIPCQHRARARMADRVPITPIVRPSVPFVMCHADCIGPLDPPSSKGHRYALCIIDSCT